MQLDIGKQEKASCSIHGEEDKQVLFFPLKIPFTVPR